MTISYTFINKDKIRTIPLLKDQFRGDITSSSYSVGGGLKVTGSPTAVLPPQPTPPHSLSHTFSSK